MDSFLLRLRREAEDAVTEAAAGGGDATTSGGGGGGGGPQSKINEMKDKLIEEFKSCELL